MHLLALTGQIMALPSGSACSSMAPEKPAGSVFFHRTGTKCLFYLRYSADKGFHTFSDKIPALRFGQILSKGGLQKCKAESCGEDCHCKTFKILSGKFAAMFHLPSR